MSSPLTPKGGTGKFEVTSLKFEATTLNLKPQTSNLLFLVPNGTDCFSKNVFIPVREYILVENADKPSHPTCRQVCNLYIAMWLHT